MEILNFKEWLKQQDVDVDVFWENCLPQNQGWTDDFGTNKMEDLGKKDPFLWIENAFSFTKALQHNTVKWFEIESAWDKEVKSALQQGTQIEFGLIE